MPIEFKYYLKKDATTYYAVINDNVVETGVKTPLRHNIDGWANTKTRFVRDLIKMGIFVESSLPSDFVKDGAMILEKIYLDIKQGIDGVCFLYIEWLVTATMMFEPFMTQAIDFSMSKHLSDKFIAATSSDGLKESLESFANTPYSVDLNDVSALSLNIDGMYVQNKGSWYPGNYSDESTSDEYVSAVTFVTTDAGIGGRSVNLNKGDKVDQIAPFIRAHTQGGFTGNAIALVDQAYDDDNPSPDDGQYIFYSNSYMRNVEIDGAMKIGIKFPAVAGIKTIRIRALVVDKTFISPSIRSATLLHTFISSANNTRVDWLAKCTGTIPEIPANCYVVIVISAQTPSGGAGDRDAFFPIESGYFNVKFQARATASGTKALRYYDVVRLLLNQLSPGSNVISSLLNTDNSDSISRFNNWDTSPYWECLTSGKALRGLPNQKLKIEWQEIENDLLSTKGVGIGAIGNDLIIEKLPHFFNNTEIARIEKINNLEIDSFKEKIFINQKVGYDYKPSTTTVNGSNAFNTTLNFVSDTSRRNKESKDDIRVSTFIKEPSQIEALRAQTLDQDEASNTDDNSIIGIEVAPVAISGSHFPYRAGTITGIDDPVGVYNVALSSGRIATVNMPFDRSVLTHGNLIFQTSDQNDEMKSDLGSGLIIEKSNLPLDNDIYMGHNVSRLFLPYVFTFDCVPVFNLYQKIKDNPYGYLTFVEYGVEIKVYILSVELTPITGECKIVGISHPNNDLTKIKSPHYK